MVAEKRGFLLLETLLAVLILVALMTIIVPTISRLQQSKITRQHILERLTLERMITEQFHAQFARTGRHGCYPQNRFIEIGVAEHAPNDISRNALNTESDWIMAQDIGLCSTYGTMHEGRTEAVMPCDGLKVADVVHVSNCLGTVSASILSVTRDHLIAMSDTLEILNGPVLVATQQTFYWYIAAGRSQSVGTLWRKPADIGRASELQSNLSHMRLYPLVDRDHDGISDEIVSQPSRTSLNDLEGLLVEFRYQLPHCNFTRDPAANLQYQTLRGDRWRYDNVCSGIGKVIVEWQGA